MNEKIIYNCHSHIFTHENLPNGYFPFFLIPAARLRVFRWLLSGVMKMIVPWTKNDKVHRYAAFVKAAYRKKQEDNLKQLIGYYPTGTKFIILPMDMAYMGAGKVKEDIDEQHNELARLTNAPDYQDILIPFAHIEPRRPSALKRLTSLIENDGFKGVKIYPTFGYRPDDKILMEEIYPYMVEKNIPLLAHCSPGFITSKEMSKKAAQALASPHHYKKVMAGFPELRICLAHFGGIDEWRRHLHEKRNIENKTWLKQIIEMMQSGKYPNLYADISHTIFNYQENAPFLKILLQDERILSQVLFGSDFYMVESEKYSEKQLSTDLRATLDETVFWTIANKNPLKYLGQG